MTLFIVIHYTTVQYNTIHSTLSTIIKLRKLTIVPVIPNILSRRWSEGGSIVSRECSDTVR